jgi:hypothetical protein
MSDEFGNWNALTKLWLARSQPVAQQEVERHAWRQHRNMVALAAAEAAGLVLAFIAAVWIAMHTAFVAMSAISVVFFGVCGYLQHRMRREAPPDGGHDLLTSLSAGVAREEWNLAQLGVGRAVTLVTLGAIAMLDSDHLRYFEQTPAARLWTLLAITSLVLMVLAWNLVLTRLARRRKARLEDFARRLGA